jgi:hypothetical protein
MTNETGTIVLDTPEQINAWVLMSRISQCHLHMKGIKVPGLLKWLRANVPDCANARTVKAAYCGLLDYCDQFGVSAPGGEQCNYQLLMTPTALNGLYFDMGIVPDLDASVPENVKTAYGEGRVVILRTMDDVRDRDTSIQMVMGE